jgi:glycosyltransferase involved in cell wall biosynthesis
MPFFSIIIPLYNKEKFIENTLKSIINQSFTDFEIIIINDGSSDKSEEKVMNFNDSRIRYYLKKNSGVSATRNYGIAKSNSNYITFIDADDYWFTTFLQEMFTNIQKYTQLKVFTAAIEIQTSKKVFPARYSIKKTNDCEIVNYFDASKKESVIWTSCAVFHKSIFEQVGNFDTTLKNGEDIDLWIRIGLIYPILFSWKILARYVYDAKSLSKNHQFSIDSINFSKYNDTEKTNIELKKFLDLNRFSLAMKSKLLRDKKKFNKFYVEINLNNLSLKKRILLKLSPNTIELLVDFKFFLTNIGLGNSVFK